MIKEIELVDPRSPSGSQKNILHITYSISFINVFLGLCSFDIIFYSDSRRSNCCVVPKTYLNVKLEIGYRIKKKNLTLNESKPR